MSQNVNVNLTPGGYPKEFHVSQYDVGRQLVVKVVDSTGDYSIPSGATVVLVGTKPSGFGFTLNGTVSGSTVTFTTVATVTAEYGRIPCEIRITNGSTILGTANCMLVVEMSPHPEGTTDGDGEQIISEITLLLQRITEQADRADQAVTDATAQADRATAQATAAAGSAANAATSETNAATSAATAVGAKNDAVAAKTAAQASEASAAESAAEARETLETYAKVDGEYDSMTVGTAKALLGDVISESTEPYTFRQTGGGLEVGTREVVEQVVGGTVAWNQLAREMDATYWGNTGQATVSISDGVATVNSTAAFGGVACSNRSITFPKTHKFLVRADVKADTSDFAFQLGISDNINFSHLKLFYPSSQYANFATYATIFDQSSDVSSDSSKTVIVRMANTAAHTFYVKNIMVIDLTAMFGTTIADAIYAMEQATTGAGVAWFKKLFQKSYYPYDAGSLQSSKPSAHVTAGFNQWDEEWEVGSITVADGIPTSSTTDWRSKNYIGIFPRTNYHIHNGGTATQFVVYYYDADKNYLNYAFTTATSEYDLATPSDARYMKFVLYQASTHYGMTYHNNICINISSSENGTYEPYDAHTYMLPNVELRGRPKWVSGKLSYDGDILEPSGRLARKYGIVDLGTLDWEISAQGTEYERFKCVYAMLLKGGECICSRLLSVPYGDVYNHVVNNSIAIHPNAQQIEVYASAYTDAASFKTAMSGVYLVYELATPTTETADPYTAIQICDPDGTEEWIDERTVPIPVGSLTKYTADLVGKLADLPTIPSAPSANGTYTLKATVSGGTVTYSWVNG